MNLHTRTLALAISTAFAMSALGIGAPAAATATSPDLDLANAIPLRADTPSWVTPELLAKVEDAASRAAGYDFVKDEEVPLSASAIFIRPGAMMISPSICTMNFLFENSGTYYMGSAGHCNAGGSSVVILAAPSVLVGLGTTTTSHNNGIGDDYSLVRISTSWYPWLDANVAVIQGPSGGVYSNPISPLAPVAAKHYGHGLVVGTGGTPRAGVVLFQNVTETAFYCHCVVTPGDSGSPILATTAAHPLGQGLGIITHLVPGSATGAITAGTRLTLVPADLVDGDINPLPPP